MPALLLVDRVPENGLFSLVLPGDALLADALTLVVEWPEGSTSEIAITLNPSERVGVADADGDGFGVLNPQGCADVPLGDCNDADDSIFPGAVDICDGVDRNCNPAEPDEEDADGDGFFLCDVVPDCDDNDSDIHPGAVEEPGSIEDLNCDGRVPVCWVDLDGDGFGGALGTPVVLGTACPMGETEVPGDCVDDDDNNNPGLSERCDGQQNDCVTIGDVDAGFRSEDVEGLVSYHTELGDAVNAIQDGGTLFVCSDASWSELQSIVATQPVVIEGVTAVPPLLSGTWSTAGNVTFSHLDLVPGAGVLSSDGTEQRGGAIHHDGGALTLNDVFIDGSTVTPTIEQGPAILDRGGAVYALGNVHIMDGSMEGCRSNRSGGALHVEGGLTVENWSATGHRSGLGGAIWMDGSIDLNTVTVSDNVATPPDEVATGQGGGIFAELDTTESMWQDVEILRNDAEEMGGIRVLGSTAGSRLVLSDVDIQDNTTDDGDAGMWMATEVDWNGGSLTGNQVTNSGVGGGSFFGLTNLDNVLVESNVGGTGGLSIRGDGVLRASNSTFSGNQGGLGAHIRSVLAVELNNVMLRREGLRLLRLDGGFCGRDVTTFDPLGLGGVSVISLNGTIDNPLVCHGCQIPDSAFDGIPVPDLDLIECPSVECGGSDEVIDSSFCPAIP